mmetsp:Transcript_44199/g.117880  ORF Transcript_44199/g.117880 Transcript_44199/m.117880 type:complete len:387 (-) Transcript_44199:296-1456(-)
MLQPLSLVVGVGKEHVREADPSSLESLQKLVVVHPVFYDRQRANHLRRSDNDLERDAHRASAFILGEVDERVHLNCAFQLGRHRRNVLTIHVEYSEFEVVQAGTRVLVEVGRARATSGSFYLRPYPSILRAVRERRVGGRFRGGEQEGHHRDSCDDGRPAETHGQDAQNPVLRRVGPDPDPSKAPERREEEAEKERDHGGGQDLFRRLFLVGGPIFRFFFCQLDPCPFGLCEQLALSVLFAIYFDLGVVEVFPVAEPAIAHKILSAQDIARLRLAEHERRAPEDEAKLLRGYIPQLGLVAGVEHGPRHAARVHDEYLEPLQPPQAVLLPQGPLGGFQRRNPLEPAIAHADDKASMHFFLQLHAIAVHLLAARRSKIARQHVQRRSG